MPGTVTPWAMASTDVMRVWGEAKRLASSAHPTGVLETASGGDEQAPRTMAAAAAMATGRKRGMAVFPRYFGVCKLPLVRIILVIKNNQNKRGNMQYHARFP
jgi:hypothetical protein